MIKRSDIYREIGERVRERLFPQLQGVRIAWLVSDKAKKNGNKLIFADCRKTTAQYLWCCDYDFMITVYEPNVDYMNDQQIEILLEHELMHVGWKDDGPCIIPHDAEEFTEIIRKYGIDWAKP